MTNCGFRIRVNGVWVNVEGVERGVSVATERPSDGFTSIGGVAHDQRARRARRTWTVDLGRLEGPEVVAALMVAASGDGGEDVMLWDEQAARANMLDPVAIASRADYPHVLCGTAPLRSLTRGPSGAASFEDIALKANVAIGSDGMAWDWPGVAVGTQDALVKVSVPPAPAGIALTSSQLILPATSVSGAGTVTTRLASNAWVETGSGFGQTATGYWSSVPGGAVVGSGPAGAVTTIPLSGVAAFAGSDMSLRLSIAGSGSPNVVFNPRTFASGFPVLRLNYGAVPEPRVFTQHIPAGVAQTLSFWTDAADGTVIGTRTTAAGATVNVAVPTTGASGLRKVNVTIPAPGSDFDCLWTIHDSTSYLLAGLGLATIAHDFYAAPHKTPSRVVVEDPTLTLESLYAGEQGKGSRTVTFREVG